MQTRINVVHDGNYVPTYKIDIRNIHHNQSMNVSGGSTRTLPAGKALRVGCAVYRANPDMPLNAEIFIGNTSYKKYIFNTSYNRCLENIGNSELKMAYGSEKSDTVNGVTIKYRDIYIVNKSTKNITDQIYVRFSPTGLQTDIYNWSLTSDIYNSYIINGSASGLTILNE